MLHSPSYFTLLVKLATSQNSLCFWSSESRGGNEPVGVDHGDKQDKYWKYHLGLSTPLIPGLIDPRFNAEAHTLATSCDMRCFCFCFLFLHCIGQTSDSKPRCKPVRIPRILAAFHLFQLTASLRPCPCGSGRVLELSLASQASSSDFLLDHEVKKQSDAALMHDLVRRQWTVP